MLLWQALVSSALNGMNLVDYWPPLTGPSCEPIPGGPAQIERTAGMPGLPEKIAYYVPNGQIVAEYAVIQSAKLNGLTLPTKFELVKYKFAASSGDVDRIEDPNKDDGHDLRIHK